MSERPLGEPLVEQIWQCKSCGVTFPEYVNGCPHHDDGAHPVELVLEDEGRS